MAIITFVKGPAPFWSMSAPRRAGMMDATMIVTKAPSIARGAVFSCATQTHMHEPPAHPSHHIRLTPDMHISQAVVLTENNRDFVCFYRVTRRIADMEAQVVLRRMCQKSERWCSTCTKTGALVPSSAPSAASIPNIAARELMSSGSSPENDMMSAANLHT